MQAATNPVAGLDQQDALTGSAQLAASGEASGAGANNDRVVHVTLRWG
jgi:hypothetical protein